MVEGTSIQTIAGRLIDEAIESLGRFRDHPDERESRLRLERLRVSLIAVALALDYQMEGETGKAAEALERADWTRRNQVNNPFGFGFAHG